MGEYIPVLIPGRSRFAPKPLPTSLAAAAIAVFTALGFWQLDRAGQKRALARDFTAADPAIDYARLPADAPRFQRVTLRGRYDADHQFLLDNRSHQSVAGVEVLTPLFLDDGRSVLVNRGWKPLGPTRTDLPDVAVGGEMRTVVGRLDELPRPGVWLEAPPATGWPRLVQYPRMTELSAALGRPLEPRQVLLDPGVPDGYVRAWTVPGAPPDRHLGYAVQWFAFAALAAAIWIFFSFRKAGNST